MTNTVIARPELIELDSAACGRVLGHVAAAGGHCEGCGGTQFAAGDALYLGFLFLDEEQDAYMVALRCRAPDCPTPRTGIRLRGKDFLS